MTRKTKKRWGSMTGIMAIGVMSAAILLAGCSKKPADSTGTTGAGTTSASTTGAETTSAETTGAASQPSTQPAGETKLKVMTSFYPVYDFAVKIGGDKADVTNMVPAGMEPHDWEPAATDIKNLEQADLFIYSGASMEDWTQKVLASLENKKLVSVEASDGLKLRKGHGEGTYDPHVWLYPLNAKKEMENIKDGYVKADPANKDYYENNYKTYADKFDKLDQEYKTTLAALPHKDIVVSHEAFGYLCDAYGLTQMGIEGLTPDSEPDPARMAEIIDFVKKNNVKVIFFEELASPKVAKAVSSETGASTAVLNPLEGLTDAEISAGNDYFSVMEANLQQLVAALK